MADPDTVVPFPSRERATPPAPAASTSASDGDDQPTAAVEHDGRLYAADRLMRELPPHSVREVGAMGPRTLQAFWDEVVRRWPAMADEVAARVGDQGA
jgi:hypothetical protein